MCRAHRSWEGGAGSPLVFPRIKRAPERHGVRGRCASMTLTAALPAHCRLVSGHDLWSETVAAPDCTVRNRNVAVGRLDKAQLHGTRPQGPHTGRAPLLPSPTVAGRALAWPGPSHPAMPRPAATRRDRPGAVRGSSSDRHPNRLTHRARTPSPTPLSFRSMRPRRRVAPARTSRRSSTAPRRPPSGEADSLPGRRRRHASVAAAFVRLLKMRRPPAQKGAPDHADSVRSPRVILGFSPPRASQCSGRSTPSRDRPLTARFVGRCPGARLAE